MSPERKSSPQNELNEGEWRFLVERLPVMVELAEVGVHRHMDNGADIMVLPIEHVDGRELDHYYVYHVANQDVMIYDIEPALRRLRVYNDKQFSYLRNFETAGTNLEFDEIVGTTMPNAQNLAGLRAFLRELQAEDELLARFNED